MATLFHPTTPRPWLAASALVAAVAGGLCAFWLGKAPASYLPVNLGSLSLAVIAMLAAPAGWLGSRGATWIVAICLAGMGATLVMGFNLDGVRRWLPLGPVQLHAGMLLLPAMLAALPLFSDRGRLAVVAAVAGLVLLQPDFAAALALGAGYIASHWRRWREPLVAAGHGVVALCAIVGALRTVSLAPVRFVENMVADSWMLHPGLGIFIVVALLFAVAAPAWAAGSHRDSVLGVSGAWAGFAAASMIGAYPTPLAGYGASTILGYGLAIAVLRGLPARG